MCVCAPRVCYVCVMCAHMGACLCVFSYMWHVYVLMCVSVLICVCMCVLTCVSMCMCAHVCEWVFSHVCVCVYNHTCAEASGLPLLPSTLFIQARSLTEPQDTDTQELS